MYFYLFRINAVPSWPDLNHFPRALSMAFSDGRKYEDLLKVSEFYLGSLSFKAPAETVFKVVLHGSVGFPTRMSSLVELIRKQAELRTLESLDVHTEDTVAIGRQLVLEFHELSLVCFSLIFQRIILRFFST